MPYVERRNGVIVGVYANPQPGYAVEFLADNAAELLAFMAAPVPQSVSRFQAKAALASIGKLDDADAAVAASNDPLLQLAWAEAPDFPRNSAGINALAPALGLSQADLDDLFIAAAGISA